MHDTHDPVRDTNEPRQPQASADPRRWTALAVVALAQFMLILEQILREAAEIDQAEDHQHGPTRGDELPAELASPTGRLARLRQAKARLEAEAAERQRRYQQRVAELAARPGPAASNPASASSPDAATRRPTPRPPRT